MNPELNPALLARRFALIVLFGNVARCRWRVLDAAALPPLRGILRGNLYTYQ